MDVASARWRVELLGSTRELARARSQDWQVTEQNDATWLTCVDFDARNDPIDVLDQAENILAVICTLVEWKTGNLPVVRTGQVVERNPSGLGETSTQVMRATPALRTARLSPPSANAGQTASAPSLEEQMDALRGDATVSQACRFYRAGRLRQSRMVNYWKVYELIRYDVEHLTGTTKALALGPNGVGWVSDEDFRRFRAVVHDQSVSGDDARHAVPGGPSHSNPMRPAEATEFIRSLFQRWVHWRYNRQATMSP